jgi:hypothetical protein
MRLYVSRRLWHAGRLGVEWDKSLWYPNANDLVSDHGAGRCYNLLFVRFKNLGIYNINQGIVCLF